MTSRWSIRKWYLDCVADDGTAWIGYWGDLRWGALRVAFASSGDWFAVRREPEPQLRDGRLSWSAGETRAELTARIPGTFRELHAGVRWHCVMPMADAVVELPGRTLRGRGYAEVLEMAVPPWRLPIRELRWGRATCAETSLVWIRWTGAAPLQLVVRNGVVETPEHIGDEELRLGDGTRVAFSDRAVIRADHLGVTLRPLKLFLPRMLSGAVEQKWRSRGTVFDGERPIDEGWVIHELLTFAD